MPRKKEENWVDFRKIMLEETGKVIYIKRYSDIIKFIIKRRKKTLI